jgi:hypothetical protein
MSLVNLFTPVIYAFADCESRYLLQSGDNTRDEGHLNLGGQWTKLRRDRMPKTKKAIPQTQLRAAAVHKYF